jgi:hypothetical protein
MHGWPRPRSAKVLDPSRGFRQGSDSSSAATSCVRGERAWAAGAGGPRRLRRAARRASRPGSPGRRRGPDGGVGADRRPVPAARGDGGGRWSCACGSGGRVSLPGLRGSPARGDGRPAALRGDVARRRVPHAMFASTSRTAPRLFHETGQPVAAHAETPAYGRNRSAPQKRPARGQSTRVVRYRIVPSLPAASRSCT